MPTVDIDVNNIPDIIEAQLTLSYSRLSELIRVIIDQGNTHEDDIFDLRQRLDSLEKENAAMKATIEELRTGKEQDGKLVENFQKEVRRLTELTEEAAESAAAAKAVEDTALNDALEDMQQQHSSLEDQISQLKNECRLSFAFTKLWAGSPQHIMAMAAPAEDNPDDFEHTVSEQTDYLHTLPAFSKLFDELSILKELLSKQAADALSAKTQQRTHSLQQNRSGSQSFNVDRSYGAVQPATVMNGCGLTPEEADAQRQKLSDAIERLTSLEERLHGILEHSDRDDGKDSSYIPAIADLQHRVDLLEQVVEGLPRLGKAFPSSGGANSPERVGESRGGANLTPPLDPAVSARRSVEAFESMHGAVVGDTFSAGASVVSNGGPPNKSLLATATATELSGTCLPMLPLIRTSISGSTSPADPRLPDSTSSGVYPSGRSTQHHQRFTSRGGLTASYPTTPDSNSQPTLLNPRPGSSHISQPVLENLIREKTSSPTPLTRRISMVVQQEDGLRLRVAQLEENTAILEVHKADRSELQQLQLTLQNLIQQGGVGIAPCRPPFTGVPNQLNGNSAPMQRMRSPVPSGSFNRNSSAPCGRPVFVSGSTNVNLRDGATLTNATISPTRMGDR